MIMDYVLIHNSACHLEFYRFISRSIAVVNPNLVL